MKCSKAYKYFEYSLVNKLSQNQISELNSHLQNCEKCSKIFNEVKITYNLNEHFNLTQTDDPYFFARLMAKIENRQHQKQTSFVAKLKPAIITSWFLIAFIVGIAVGNTFIDTIENNSITSSSQLNNDENFIEVFNLSEVDKESLEYLLLQ